MASKATSPGNFFGSEVDVAYTMSVKVLIFGGRGFMGQQFLRVYPDAILPSADIADPKAVIAVLDQEKPDVVINAAGKTGVPNVDWCEDHKLETIRSNVTGPLVLLEECQKRGIYWAHLSSGCIYEGDNQGRGFTEEDEPNFVGSFYSRTKAWSERTLREFTDRKEDRGGILILRLRMPFDGSTHPRNLLMKLARYHHVLDVANSITYLPDFLSAAEKLIAERATGIFNVVNPGPISPFRIVELYRDLINPEHQFERLLLGSLSQVVRAGRSNCILRTDKLTRHGITLQSAEDSVKNSLLEMKMSPDAKEKQENMSKTCIQ